MAAEAGVLSESWPLKCYLTATRDLEIGVPAPQVLLPKHVQTPHTCEWFAGVLPAPSAPPYGNRLPDLPQRGGPLMVPTAQAVNR